MTDMLLVHDIGHSSWFWGPVWGHLTAPVSHPPKLYETSTVGKVHIMELPEHHNGLGVDRKRSSFSDYVSSITSEVRQQNLRDVVMVGHGLSAPLLLQAADDLEEPPKQIVLFAGVVPGLGKSAASLIDRKLKLTLMLMGLNSAGRGKVKLPRAALSLFYCNGMDPFQMVPMLGRFNPLPLNMFRSKMHTPDLSQKCPITYVPLARDNVVSKGLQQRIATSIPGATIADSLDTCHEGMIEKPLEMAEVLRRYC